jgi:hypothetical protein
MQSGTALTDSTVEQCVESASNGQLCLNALRELPQELRDEVLQDPWAQQRALQHAQIIQNAERKRKKSMSHGHQSRKRAVAANIERFFTRDV